MNSAPLSTRARFVWAKTDQDFIRGGELSAWLPLYQHLDDAAGVAERLWDEWAPRSIKRTLSNAVGSEEEARALLVWLAGTHDVGKASPAFAVQGGELVSAMERSGLRCDPRIRDDPNRAHVRHELVSFLAIRDRLVSAHGFDSLQAEQIASVAAAHHGLPASPSQAADATRFPHLVGIDSWARTREELLIRAERTHLTPNSFLTWKSARLTQPVLVLLSSLVIVADWIASSDLFALAPLHDFPVEPTDHRVTAAWRELDFPRPWSATVEDPDASAMLTRRFDLPPGATPHASQAALVARAQQMEHPELMILEAEMGSGKTEAALLAAEILAAKFGLSGIFVGLPTQATSDGMFSRVLTWAERLDLDTPANIFLARGRAELNQDYAKKRREAYFSSIAVDDDPKTRKTRSAPNTGESIIAHRWFSNSRRGPLSTFVVGTVDQALFAGLRSRYLMLRHLALAGKVVIIDEVHAYDEYMRVYLSKVLEWLGAYGVPVILLSATLPSSHRQEFLAAYDRGRDALTQPQQTTAPTTRAERLKARKAVRDAQATRHDSVRGLIGYPVITTTNHAGLPLIDTPATTNAPRSVRIDRIDDEPATLIKLIRTETSGGGNVAILRNTVRRAQETVTALRDAFPDVEVTLAHSRYLGLDRAAKDRALLQRYGRNAERPHTSIVVATQVIEQSLDVDFDLMVTDMAPIDLLIQRIGRLHRHRRTRPPQLHTPRLVITAIDETEDVPQFDPGSEHVYERAVLLRSLAVLRERSSISLPDDIAPLVEHVYSENDAIIPRAWQLSLTDADKKQKEKTARRKHEALTYALYPVNSDKSLLGWVKAPDSDPELAPPGRGTVRDGEETLEVIVLQSDTDGTLRTPSWLPRGGGQQIPDNEAPDAALTRIILGCFLRLPVGMCRGDALDRHIDALERSFALPAWHTSHALRGELVLVLDHQGHARLNEFKVYYSAEDGLKYEVADAR